MFNLQGGRQHDVFTPRFSSALREPTFIPQTETFGSIRHPIVNNCTTASICMALDALGMDSHNVIEELTRLSRDYPKGKIQLNSATSKNFKMHPHCKEKEPLVSYPPGKRWFARLLTKDGMALFLMYKGLSIRPVEIQPGKAQPTIQPNQVVLLICKNPKTGIGHCVMVKPSGKNYTVYDPEQSRPYTVSNLLGVADLA